MTSASEKSQIPVGKLGWLVLVLVVGAPLAFFYLATPKPAAPAIDVDATPTKRAPTKLEAVGLRDYRDWDGLPEIFAVWADRAHWKNERTRFAYWNPGNQSYSYYFEARRTAGGYRFREILEPRDNGFQWDPDASEDIPLRLYLPIRPRLEDPVKPLEKPIVTPPAQARPAIPVDVKQPKPPAAPQSGWENDGIGTEPKKP